MLTFSQLFSLCCGLNLQTKSNLTIVLDFNAGAKVILDLTLLNATLLSVHIVSKPTTYHTPVYNDYIHLPFCRHLHFIANLTTKDFEQFV